MRRCFAFPFRWPALIVVWTLVLTGSSAASSDAQSAGRHPDRRYVDESFPVTARLRFSGPRGSLPLALDGAPIGSIGTEAGPEETIFGDIADLGATANGNVVVVDRKVQDVRLFDPQGRFLKRLGRAGQGPGEFRAPHSLFVTPNDEIWIADMQRRLTVYAPRAGSYALLRTMPTPFGIRSMCLLGGELFTNAPSLDDPHIIRVLDSLARPLRVFGRLYTSPNRLLNYQFSEGRVACVPEHDLVVYASNAALGDIRAYRRDGTPVWRTLIDDVRTNVITDGADGRTSVAISNDGAHVLLSLNAVSGVGIIVQYGYRTYDEMVAKEPVVQIQTVLLDPASGAATLSSTAWPRLARLRGAQAFAVFEDPAPRVEVRRLRITR